MNAPLEKYLVEAADEARIERVHRRLRASRDSLASRWRWHFAVAAALVAALSWTHFHRAPELAETQCVVIIVPAKPTQIIGDNC